MYKYKHKTTGEVIVTSNKVTSKNWEPVKDAGKAAAKARAPSSAEPMICTQGSNFLIAVAKGEKCVQPRMTVSAPKSAMHSQIGTSARCTSESSAAVRSHSAKVTRRGAARGSTRAWGARSLSSTSNKPLRTVASVASTA